MNLRTRSVIRMLFTAVILTGMLASEANAGWPRIGGAAGKLGGNISSGWKNTAGASWNRGVRDPWEENVYNPVFVDPYVKAYNKYDQSGREAAARIEEQKRRAYEEARQRWNNAYWQFETQVRQFAIQNAQRFGIRNLNDLNRFVEMKRQEWVRANPFPQM